MNVYKPLIIFNLIHSVTILTDGCTNFRKYLVEGTKPNLKKIKADVNRSLMLVTALAPIIGYDKASEIAHYALERDLSLKQAAVNLGFVTEEEFDRVVDPEKMVRASVRKLTKERHPIDATGREASCVSESSRDQSSWPATQPISVPPAKDTA